MGIMFFCSGMREEDVVPVMIMMLLGGAISAAGIWVLVWHLKDKLKHTGGKVDKNQEYVFTMSTLNGTEVVNEYGQIERALKQLGQTKQGMVEIKIEPSIANICSIECCYKNGYFETYVQQIREDGIGYWFMLADGIEAVEYDIKQLYVKKKKIDFKYYNRRETGEGR